MTLSNSSTDDRRDSTEVVLGLMAKFWTVGDVKTRLGQSVGMHRAARLHKLFVQVVTDNLSGVGQQRIAVVTPKQKANRFAAQISPHWSIAHQAEGDLGDRMQHWFQSVLGAPAENQNRLAILIGADCPMLDPDAMVSAAELLSQNDIVLGPAMDGGYYLIGIRGPWRGQHELLFDDMPWSSEHVFSETVQRCIAANFTVGQLPHRDDIDTAESLQRLRQTLAQVADSDPKWSRLSTQIEAILLAANDQNRDEDFFQESSA